MSRQSLRLPTVCGAFIALCLGLAGVFTIESHAAGEFGSVFVVDSDGDESDSSLSDDICNTSKGECTLRAAIEQANATTNVNAETPDEIGFAIAGPDVHTIVPLFSFPAIVEAVRIDGYTQGGASPNTMDVGSDAVLKIEIDGSLAGGLTFGLTLESNGSTIRGLVINRFEEANILLDGANENHIEGNYIGTDPTGTIARPNRADGIALWDSAANVIGGASPDKRNVISGNNWNGIAILNGPSQDNAVEGNYIGTDPSGMNEVPNGGDGVIISALVGLNTYASRNRIESAALAPDNATSFPATGGLVCMSSAVLATRFLAT
jgi:CSLREA domain-containing protein